MSNLTLRDATALASVVVRTALARRQDRRAGLAGDAWEPCARFQNVTGKARAPVLPPDREQNQQRRLQALVATPSIKFDVKRRRERDALLIKRLLDRYEDGLVARRRVVDRHAHQPLSWRQGALPHRARTTLADAHLERSCCAIVRAPAVLLATPYGVEIVPPRTACAATRRSSGKQAKPFYGGTAPSRCVRCWGKRASNRALIGRNGERSTPLRLLNLAGDSYSKGLS